jgi:hypothetical protein
MIKIKINLATRSYTGTGVGIALPIAIIILGSFFLSPHQADYRSYGKAAKRH